MSGPLRQPLSLVLARLRQRKKSSATTPTIQAYAPFMPAPIPTIYTDGSFFPGFPPRAGIGCYIAPDHPSNYSAPLVPPCETSTGAEIQAAVTGLEILIRTYPEATTYRVLTDCTTVVTLLSGTFEGKERWLTNEHIGHAQAKLLKPLALLASKGAKLEAVHVGRNELTGAHALAQKAAVRSVEVSCCEAEAKATVKATPDRQREKRTETTTRATTETSKASQKKAVEVGQDAKKKPKATNAQKTTQKKDTGKRKETSKPKDETGKGKESAKAESARAKERQNAKKTTKAKKPASEEPKPKEP